MKKLLAFLLVLLLTASVFVLPVGAIPTAEELGGFTQSGITLEAATTKEGIYYKLKEDGTIAVCGAPEGLTEFIVPSEIEGLKVTELATHHQRFPGASTIETLVVPEGVEVINGSLSSFTNATKIQLPSTLIKITNINFFNTSTYYKDKSNWDNGCLYIGTNLISVSAEAPEVLEIREDTTCIADDLYRPLTANVKEIILPTFEVNGLSNLIPRLSLERVTIPAEFKEVPAGLFYSCDKLTDVTVEEGITKIGDRAFFRCKSLSEIKLPSSVTTIGVRSFGMCNGFTEFNVPDTVTKVEKQAFAGCENLKLVEIPASVIEIGEEAFGFGGHYYSDISDHGLAYYETEYFTICAPKGSAGEKYAKMNEFNYEESREDYEASMDEVDYDNPRDFDEFVFGDVDLDGRVTVKDATLIQKHAAHITELQYKVQYFVSSVNFDFDINVRDATMIQKHLAKMEVDSPIGDTFTWEELFSML